MLLTTPTPAQAAASGTNSYGDNIDQKTECEQGEDYEVGIDFHRSGLRTSGTAMQAINQPPAPNLDAPRPNFIGSRPKLGKGDHAGRSGSC